MPEIRNDIPSKKKSESRRGVAALDYVLVLGVVLPMIAFVVWAAPLTLGRVYDMINVLMSWPFM